MNINVIVLNVRHDLTAAALRQWGKGRPGDFARTCVNPDSHAPVEEIIELTPQNGVWVGERETRGGRAIELSDGGPELRLPNLPSVTTYDRRGNLIHTTQGKGLRIDLQT